MKLKIDINNLLEWFKTKGLARRTIHDYLTMIYLLDNQEITEQSLLKWVYDHKQIRYSRAALLNLFDFIKANKSLYDKELLDLIRGFEFPKITAHKRRRFPQIISIEEVFNIAFAMPDEEYKLMTLLTFHLGLRRQELFNIQISNFNWDEWVKAPESYGTLIVIGKGDKQRNLPVPYEIMTALNKFITSKLHKDPKRIKLFRKHGSQWNMVLNEIALKTINRKVNPHLLRHSCASYLREQGLDLREIQEFLGHESIATTQLYTYVKPIELNRKVIEAFG